MSKIGVFASPSPIAVPADLDGLVYVTGTEPGIRRRRAGRGFVYLGPDGARVTDPATLARIRSLAIPPAYGEVWIAADEGAHIQATGRDQRGRKQYRYHPGWSELRAGTKFDRLPVFAEALPGLRDRVQADLGRAGLPREKVLATVVTLLETTLIRVGNEDYARRNGSYGLTTLRPEHVELAGGELRFDFQGKSGKLWRLAVKDRRVARIVRGCQELPGQTLFRYRAPQGETASVTSADVNAYLREITGEDITAKHFRTWAGTVMAAEALAGFGSPGTERQARRAVAEAIRRVAARLGNTAAVCRTSYVHPTVIRSFMDDRLVWQPEAEVGVRGLKPEERATLRLLREGT